MDDATLRRNARTLAATLEPLIGQVYFAPECHDAYASLGFAPSPGTFNNVAMPDGPAYFTSRGSLLGQVQPDVIAAAFGVFKPEVVVDGVTAGWSITDDDLPHVSAALERAADATAVPGRPLFAGLRAWWDDPTDPWTRFFHLGDMMREGRGDAHVVAWSGAGLDAVEIGLLTEAYMGLPLRTYIRTRAWNDEELDAAHARLQARGWFEGDVLTPAGKSAREAIETTTDVQMRPAVEALGAEFGEVIDVLRPWGDAMRHAGGYIGGPVDLWPNRG
jgi:hypothetical protein